MEQINYEKLIPQEPITDVVAFAQQQGEFENAYMIYRSERVYDPLNIGTVCSVPPVDTHSMQRKSRLAVADIATPPPPSGGEMNRCRTL